MTPEKSNAVEAERLVRAWNLTNQVAQVLKSKQLDGRISRTDIAWLVDQVLDLAVPEFCDWCAIDSFEFDGQLHRFGFRHVSCLGEPQNHHELCEVPPVHDNEVSRERTSRAVMTRTTQIIGNQSGDVVSGVVVPIVVDDEPWGSLTFASDSAKTNLGTVAVDAAQLVATGLKNVLERSSLMAAHRDAVRQSQRIARQLHQLIAASIMVTGMRTEIEILRNIAASSRSVFDADTAIVSLTEGASAPLSGVARRGRVATCDAPSAELLVETPLLRIGENEPWIDGEWLVAPILVRRDWTRGIIAIRRSDQLEFGPEDREVLTLLAQMASGAVASSELGRTIEASEERLRILFETAPIGIVEVDYRGRARFWNDSASRVLSWERYRDSRSDPGPAFPEVFSLELAEMWSEVRTERGLVNRELLGVDGTGRAQILNVTAVALPASRGSEVGVLTLVDDVTNHRELKAEVRHAQSMEMRGQVASRIAHDFNNLLTLISGYAEIMARELEFDDRASQMAMEIQATASRASLLTGQLQTIGRTKATHPIVFDPVSAIQSNAEVLERILGDDVELIWQFDDHMGNIHADPDQFEQMILNLSINARDAMPQGGELSFSVEVVQVSDTQASSLGVLEGTYLKVSVTDTGVGMDEGTVANCFEPLFTTKSPFKGTGMGLASARRLMQESGGAITCRSDVGLGTTFEMIFPRVLDAAKVVEHAVEMPQGDGQSLVLVVEDDLGLRRLISQVLLRNGFRVVEAASGEDALSLASESSDSVELLVSDVILGGISGRDLAGRLQSERPNLKVLLVSGTENSSIVDGLLPGSSSFLSKPFKPSELIDRVHQVLSTRIGYDVTKG
ncbi:MAG: response regulator [Acidimicrobiaceae bacterium]|nr:response regulator [Acidimicrobiaceae bacterium]